MKVFSNEIRIYESNRKLVAIPFTAHQRERLSVVLEGLRGFAKKNPIAHSFLQFLPLITIPTLCYILINAVINIQSGLILKSTLIGLIHGYFSYCWVIYTLHEGAGHRLFIGRTALHRGLSTLAFHLSRLVGADPVQYAVIHRTHHRYLGTANDLTFTQFVLPLRILKSLIPGAGFLFKNDYKVHHGEELTPSTLVSISIAAVFLAFQTVLLKTVLPIPYVLYALLGVSLWFGFFLDRLRESIEHRWMPADNEWGGRELGVSFVGLLLGGGVSGQPCHFSHHLAPDLTWYQQVLLSFKLKKLILSESQKRLISIRSLL